MFVFFFFNDTATTEIYTLSLHDALPIYRRRRDLLGSLDQGSRGHFVRRLDYRPRSHFVRRQDHRPLRLAGERDRKSTRLNSSHANISYAVFCLKKKKQTFSLSHYSFTFY